TAPSAGIAASRNPAAPFTPFPTGRNLDITGGPPSFPTACAAEGTPEMSASRKFVANVPLRGDLPAARPEIGVALRSFYEEDASGRPATHPLGEEAAPSVPTNERNHHQHQLAEP